MGNRTREEGNVNVDGFCFVEAQEGAKSVELPPKQTFETHCVSCRLWTSWPSAQMK